MASPGTVLEVAARLTMNGVILPTTNPTYWLDPSLTLTAQSLNAYTVVAGIQTTKVELDPAGAITETSEADNVGLYVWESYAINMPTLTPTRTPSRTATRTPTSTPTGTRAPTLTPSPTATPTPTPTELATPEPCDIYGDALAVDAQSTSGGGAAINNYCPMAIPVKWPFGSNEDMLDWRGAIESDGRTDGGCISCPCSNGCPTAIRCSNGDILTHSQGDYWARDLSLWDEQKNYVNTLGVPIYSPLSGWIIHLRRTVASCGYGRTVVIWSGSSGSGQSGAQIRFAHMDSVRSDLFEGSFVSQGALIGTVGNSGCAGNPHAHIVLYYNVPYDPDGIPYSGNFCQSPGYSHPFVFIE